jgi:hypothetical protein
MPGAPMLHVKEQLRNASLTTTINQYGHMSPPVEASLADAPQVPQVVEAQAVLPL